MWHVGEMAVGEMASWQNGMLAKWHVGKISSWQNGELGMWHVGEMSGHPMEGFIACNDFFIVT